MRTILVLGMSAALVLSVVAPVHAVQRTVADCMGSELDSSIGKWPPTPEIADKFAASRDAEQGLPGADFRAVRAHMEAVFVKANLADQVRTITDLETVLVRIVPSSLRPDHDTLVALLTSASGDGEIASGLDEIHPKFAVGAMEGLQDVRTGPCAPSLWGDDDMPWPIPGGGG